MAIHRANSQFSYRPVSHNEESRLLIHSPDREPLQEITMISTKEDEIKEALREVVDPEIGLNVVELGLIREIEVGEEDTKINMILTTPFCPYGPAIIEQVRVAADTVTGGGSQVELGTELWDPSMMEEGAGGDWGLF
jgi:metal-sulfur cluster biosynthetic enzyme